MKTPLLVFITLLLLILGSAILACEKEIAPFSMQVMPDHVDPAIPGQSCVFLVVVADAGEGSGEGEAVTISATCADAEVTVQPQAITPGQVAEVTVIPEQLSTNGDLIGAASDEESPIVTVAPEDKDEMLTVTVRGERYGLELPLTSTIRVVEGEDDLAPTAAEMRDMFVPWLAENHPELDITSETEWVGTIVKPNIQVVMYYLFFSEDWEMGVQWHVTISPNDWARIYLRHRVTEAAPSHAFEINSWSAEEPELYAIDPPERVWR